MNQEEQEELNTKLIKYSKEGNLELVQYLIEQGADIHVKDDAALRVAANDNYIEVVKYLVKQWSDIHADNDGAFKMAALNNQLEIVKYFLFDCEMEIQKETKDWLIKSNKKEFLDLIEKRDLLLKLDKNLIQKDSVDNLGKKVKI